MLQLLVRNPQFLRFWTASWFSQLGYWIRNMALIFVVLRLSNNSAHALSVNMVCELAPNFIAPVLGVYSDRWDRKKTYIGCLIARIALIFAISLGVMLHSLLLIFAATLLGSIATVLMSSSNTAFVSEIVPPDDRRTATSLQQSVSSSVMLIGPPIGAGVYSLVGGTHALWICGGLYVITVILTASIRMNTQQTGNKVKSSGFLSELRDGLSYTKGHSVMKQLLLAAGLTGLAAGILNVLEVFIVTEFLHLPKTMLSILLTIQGGSMLASVPLINRFKLSNERLLIYGMLFGGVGICAMVIYPEFIVTAIGYFVMSVGQMAMNIGAATILKSGVDIQYQGRCSSLFWTAQNGIMAAMTLVTGWLHNYLSVQTLVIASGGVFLIGGLWVFIEGKNRNTNVGDSLSLE